MLTVYPNTIPCSPTYLSDALKYFVGALLDVSNSSINVNSENWPYSELEQPGPPPYLEIRNFLFSPPDFPFTPLSFPCTRQQFYNYIDRWTTSNAELVEYYNWFGVVSGSALYTFPEPLTGWTNRMVNDWGKIKTLEIGLFGSVGNGGSLANNSIVGSGSFNTVVLAITQSQLNYLRYGLTRFDSYGACHPEEAQAPAPTNPVVNTSTRTFNWTNATGFSELSNYEYYINGSEWITVTSKPISIPSNIHVPIGGLLVRTKGDGYTEPSDTIQNDAAYISPISLYIWVIINSSTSYTVYAAVIETLSVSLNITGTVNIVLTPNTNQLYPFSIFLQFGQNYATHTDFAGSINTGSSSNQVMPPVTVSPTTVDGRPINIQLNEQAPI